MTNIEGFNVRLVFSGDSYGRDDCLLHTEEEALVEFYDSRHKGFGERGQFVSRYYAKTLLKREYPQGLQLDGGVPEWAISARGMRDVRTWIFNEIFARSLT